MPADGRALPGFYFDPEKGRYFAVQPNHAAKSESKYTKEKVATEDENAKVSGSTDKDCSLSIVFDLALALQFRSMSYMHVHYVLPSAKRVFSVIHKFFSV